MTKKSTERQKAVELGLKTYEGNPCSKCGTTQKYVSRSSCVSCTTQSTKQRDPEVFKRYIKSDRGQVWLKEYRKSSTYRDVQNRWLSNSGYGRSMTAKRRQYIREQLDALTEIELVEILEIYRQAAIQTKKTGTQHHVDHIIRIADGGSHHPRNLQVLRCDEHLAKTAQENRKHK